MANRFLSNIRINDEYTLPENDGSAGQAIVTDGSGNLSFGSAVASSADSSESIHITVKNTSGAQITKGTPVYITGETGNSGKIEVAPADASDSAKMPAVGILESTLNNNAEGFCVQGGLLEGLSTETIDGTTTTANDTVYVKSGGGLTMTKPTGSNNLIQNIAKVARTHASNGSLVVSSILRTNDVPNLPTGKIWVGDGNTTVSTVVHLDETNGRMGIGTNNPNKKLDVYGDFRLGTTGSFYITQSPFTTDTFYASTANGGTVSFGAPNSFQQNVSVQGDLYAAGGSTSTAIGTKRLGSWSNKIVDSGNNYFNAQGGNLGIGTTSPSSRLHVKDVAPILKLQSSSDTTSTISFDNSLGTQRASLVFMDSNDSFKLTNVAGNSRLNLDNYTAAFSVGTNNLNQSGVILGATTLTLISNFSTALTCDYAGRVGIGTTSPSQKLHVSSNDQSTARIRLSNTSASGGDDIELVAGVHNVTQDGFSIYNASGGGTQFVIQGGGNVGIGTASPSQKLEVVGTISSGAGAGASNLGMDFGGLLTPSAMPSQVRGVIGALNSGTGVAAGSIGYQPRTGVSAAHIFFTEQSERMRITSSGDVGIGTASPGAKLDVVSGDIRLGTNATYFRVRDTASAQPRILGMNASNTTYVGPIDSYAGGGMIYGASGNVAYHGFYGGGSEKVRITSGGNVGIGTTSPSVKLEVFGSEGIKTGNASGAGLFTADGGSTKIGSFSNHRFDLTTNNITRASISTSGNVGIGTTSPSEKLHVYNGKAYVTPIPYAANQSAYALKIGAYNNTAFDMGLQAKSSSGGSPYMSFRTTSVDDVLVLRGANVGIGETNPAQKLHVVGNSEITGDIYLGRYIFHNDDTNTWLGFPLADTISFRTNGSDRMYINSSGNVGIGTTSPRSKLHAVGTAASVPALGAAASAAQIGSDTYGTLFSTLSSGRGVIQQGRSDGALLAFDLLLNPRGGNVGIGVGTSVPAYTLDVYGTGRFTGDLRCLSLIQTSQRDQKKDIANIDKSKAKAIPFKEYKYKSSIDGSERKRYGVVVEDIEDDYPELVHIGNDGIKGINYIDLLVKRVAELEKELEDISLTPGPKGDKGDAGSQGSAGANGTNGKNGVNGNDHLKNVKSITFNEKSGQLEITIEGYKETFRFNPTK